MSRLHPHDARPARPARRRAPAGAAALALAMAMAMAMAMALAAMAVGDAARAADGPARPPAPSPAPAPAPAPGTDTKALDRLAAILASVARTPLVAAPFHASKASGLLSTPVESRGTLSVDPNGRIEKHTRTPLDERVTITDEAVRIERAGSPAEELRVADDPSLAAYARGLRAVFAGDPTPLREHFDIAVRGDVADWTLVLTPKRLKVQAAVQRIVASGANGLIQRIETTDGAGDVETLSVLLKPPAAPPR
ncbi:MAG: LolA-related protein [Lautropia sp.]